ncbi:MAG: cation diffusion facilitator family transporter [Gammaproteobacteria bacterium]|nr:cation diffusion facilitator family transporter [Gammaproteobacteria bacterium]
MSNHHHHNTDSMGDRRLLLAIVVNMLLTLAQIIGGILSGSLALIADALHNFSDAASLLIAWVARKIGRRPADQFKTFGYKRAEIIAALINLVTLVLVGFYLIYEALWRLFSPQIIEGWIVIVVAGIALIIDVITALLTYRMAKESLNMRAAFLHNVSDALASLGVIVAGALILMYQWYWIDTALTLMIAFYVLYQAASLLPKTVHILMEGTPENVSLKKVINAMQSVAGVQQIYHLHVWQLDEHKNALEAHVVISDFNQSEKIKNDLKKCLDEEFSISHSTLELEIKKS